MTTSIRRQFDLSAEDVEYLDSQFTSWETIKDAGSLWVLIHNYPLPSEYNLSNVTVALQLTGYPASQIDMAYFHPALSLPNGVLIPAVSDRNIEGKVYQQWSRHRTGEFPWRSGLDNIGSHMSLVEEWLLKECRRVTVS